MNKLANWIKNHQVIAFFVITFAITWGLGFSYDAVMNKGLFLLAPLVFVATSGPALSGIIVSMICNHQPKQGTSISTWIAFLVAWIVSVLVFIANNTFINHTPLNMIGFSVILVIPVAFVISMTYSRIPAVRSYLSSLIRLRGVWGWSLPALILFPALLLLSFPVSNMLGRHYIIANHIPDPNLTLIGLIAVKFLYQLFFFNATGEEVGWRGFALPRLQAFASPLIASLVLAFFWGPWHFFLWQAEGNPVISLQFWIEQYIFMIPAAMVIVWFYNPSKGSILVAGIAHAAVNTAFAFVRSPDLSAYNCSRGGSRAGDDRGRQNVEETSLRSPSGIPGPAIGCQKVKSDS